MHPPPQSDSTELAEVLRRGELRINANNNQKTPRRRRGHEDGSFAGGNEGFTLNSLYHADYQFFLRFLRLLLFKIRPLWPSRPSCSIFCALCPLVSVVNYSVFARTNLLPCGISYHFAVTRTAPFFGLFVPLRGYSCSCLCVRFFVSRPLTPYLSTGCRL